jgi:hypothetical protein
VTDAPRSARVDAVNGSGSARREHRKWAWAEPAAWTCPRCLAIWLTAAPARRCHLCGFFEDE